MTTDDVLTDDELEALRLTGELANLVCSKIITNGPAYEQDQREFISHLHVIQYMIGAQAAARSYPSRFRLLGEVVRTLADKAIPTPAPILNDERPHSRACGWQAHDHGPACHTNCPTCHGKR